MTGSFFWWSLIVAQLEFIPKLRTALLTLITKDASNLIARGQFKDALPVTMEAIVTAQAIYYPNAPLQLVPIYLLAVQVCEFFLHNLPLNLFLVSHEHSKLQVLLFSFFFFPGCVGVKPASISLLLCNFEGEFGVGATHPKWGSTRNWILVTSPRLFRPTKRCNPCWT